MFYSQKKCNSGDSLTKADTSPIISPLPILTPIKRNNVEPINILTSILIAERLICYTIS